jgi:hypothetical protein
MEKVTKNQGGALPSAKKVVTTPINKVPSDDLKVSSEAISFRDSKAGSQPCLSFMPAMASEMRRCEDPKPASFPETSADRMRDSVRRFRESLMYSVPSIVREQAVDTLSLLIRFDSAISMDDSKILIEAVKVINKAGVAHT